MIINRSIALFACIVWIIGVAIGIMTLFLFPFTVTILWKKGVRDGHQDLRCGGGVATRLD